MGEPGTLTWLVGIVQELQQTVRELGKSLAMQTEALGIQSRTAGAMNERLLKLERWEAEQGAKTDG